MVKEVLSIDHDIVLARDQKNSCDHHKQGCHALGSGPGLLAGVLGQAKHPIGVLFSLVLGSQDATNAHNVLWLCLQFSSA